jgi:hypothetical protein
VVTADKIDGFDATKKTDLMNLANALSDPSKTSINTLINTI